MRAAHGDSMSGVPNPKMTCFGKTRGVLAALLQRSPKRDCASLSSHSFLVLDFLAAALIAQLACSIGWAGPCTFRPCSSRGGWQTVSWYQANHGAFGYGGAQARPVPPQRDREHLGQWLRQHQNMSLADQERALRTEPGFNRLPPEKQQRLYNRLQQLDAMPPARRERYLQRLETWERLSPEQRQQVRMGILEVRQMPFDRQRMMHRAVRELSEFPPGQRGEILNSWQFRHRYSNYERQILATLMLAQPYQPLRPQ
jgi:hypothetical protein